MPRRSPSGPVSYRGHLPFSENLLREVERITWDVVGHAPTSRVVVRFDRANTYYHARKCGFDGSSSDWREYLASGGDPSCYIDIRGLTVTPWPEQRARGAAIRVDVFWEPDFTTDGTWLQILAHELAHVADLCVLTEYDSWSLPRLSRPADEDEGKGQHESYANAVAAEVARRLSVAHPRLEFETPDTTEVD